MRFQLLPSTFDEDGRASARQHLSCFVIDDRVAIDAGSLGMAATDAQREQIRGIVLTHAHLDHVAGLPLFLDDLFSSLQKPLDVYATEEVITVLERDIFNWSVYPRFTELENDHGSKIMRYFPFDAGREFEVEHLKVTAIGVNHRVPSVGFLVSDGRTRIAITGDTAGMDGFWRAINEGPRPDVLLIECAFPDDLGELAEISHHLTPSRLAEELGKFGHPAVPVYVINIKPMYREQVVGQIKGLGIAGLEVLEVGRVYEW